MDAADRQRRLPARPIWQSERTSARLSQHQLTEGFDTADLKEAKVLLDELKRPHLGKSEDKIATNRTSAYG